LIVTSPTLLVLRAPVKNNFRKLSKSGPFVRPKGTAPGETRKGHPDDRRDRHQAIHEKSVEEVTAIVGAGAATVKTRMFYARRRLAELLKAAGVETVNC
jgi:hypothetical protein